MGKRGERLFRKFPRWLWFEHMARYNFAANYVRDKVVVDCACGIGVGSEIFLNFNAHTLRGFDLSDNAVEIAKRRCVHFSNSNFRVSNATKIPLPNNFCDTYISLETIEHILDDHMFLSEVRRILKYGGTFVCSTPNRSITNPHKSTSDQPWNRFHVREYNSEELEVLLNKFFKRVELYGFNKMSVKKLNLVNKFRDVFNINGFYWTNFVKFHKIFIDKLGNYEIEKLKTGYEYEYVIAVCEK